MPDTPRYPASPDAPRYTPEAWNGAVDLSGSNCFQYAYACSKPGDGNKTYDELPPLPGELGGKWNMDPVRNPATLVQAMNADGCSSSAGTITICRPISRATTWSAYT